MQGVDQQNWGDWRSFERVAVANAQNHNAQNQGVWIRAIRVSGFGRVREQNQGSGIEWELWRGLGTCVGLILPPASSTNKPVALIKTHIWAWMQGDGLSIAKDSPSRLTRRDDHGSATR